LCLQGFFLNNLKKEAQCCLVQRGGWGDTHPELLGKGEGEAEDWGEREFPGSMQLLVTSAVQVDHWKQGVTSTLGPWKLWRKHNLIKYELDLRVASSLLHTFPFAYHITLAISPNRAL
jgi:hypothetical protein